LSQQHRTKVIDSQLRVFRHPREHYQKITANLLPILSMLTSGDLGRSLSPDPFDAEDKRPIMNLDKIIRGRRVFYVALDTLPDPAVGSAIGAILLADLAALAGIRYNMSEHDPRISLYVDEISDVINQPLIQILNKGAESGIYTTCAMQTLADLAARLGSEEAARKAVGNLNNLIALRSKDRPTQDFIVETFGKTPVHSIEVSIGTHTDAHLPDFSGSVSRRLRETREETVPSDILGKLPNLQYFALVSGGRLLKGRVPILASDATDQGATAALSAT
jgi:conjugal transfer pilus assembly protein TraD